MKLSPLQEEAIDRVLDWFEDANAPQVFTLGGLAGTGKTTLLARLCEQLHPAPTLDGPGSPFVVGCPTGKAAAVLRAKGIPAATIHKLVYELADADKNKLTFAFVGLGEDHEDVEALFVDEASMVTRPMLEDLKSSGLKLLFVGDYGQLPPVGEDPGLMRNLDVKLTEVHRQKDHLLDVAYAFRDGTASVNHFKANEEVTRYAQIGTARAASLMKQADVILVGKNKTRHLLNRMMLDELMQDFVDIPELEQIDKTVMCRWLVASKKTVPMVCLSNSYEHEVMNGEMGTFTASVFDGEYLLGTWDSGAELGTRQLEINVKCLLGDLSSWSFREPGLKADFGWAITVHKAQGSEWDKVCVIDEGFGDKDPDTLQRWRYTAATRARTQLSWIGRRPYNR